VRSRPRRLLAVAAAVAVLGIAAGCGSKAPLRDCAAPLAKAQRRLTRMDAQLKALRRRDAALLAHFRALNAQLKKIDAKYPSNVLPAPVFKRYKLLQRETDAAYKRYSSSIDRTNALIVSRNAVARQFNRAAACKPSA
jgi:hypothetical protein